MERAEAVSGADGRPMAAPWRDLVERTVVLRGRRIRVTHPRDGLDLLDEEAFERDQFLPYWAELWPSALALAQMVAASELAGKRTLELGCGLALPSIAAALAGGRRHLQAFLEAAAGSGRWAVRSLPDPRQPGVAVHQLRLLP